ncbi:MAG: hypothetical protein K6E51_08860 [Treponema sp.]|nr:hypothetical protein [Treponema sp.]
MYGSDKGAPVQRLTGQTYEECRKRLYDQYGEDYEIVNRHTVLRPGFLGLFQKEQVEVSYIVKLNRGNVANARLYTKPTSGAQEISEWQRNRDEILRTTGASISSLQQAAVLDRKISELQNFMTQKFDQLAQNPGLASASDKHPNIQKIEDLLSRNEFTFKFINEVSNRLKSECTWEQLENFDALQKMVVDWVGESISIAPKKTFRAPHVIVVVGPTGVGKTTTIAKLAANILLDAKNAGKPRPEIRIITIDRTRVGAWEQLTRYGDLMNIPVNKAESAEDVKMIYDECREKCDCILIDTSGYSPNDSTHIGQMKAILDVNVMHPDVYLAVSASTKARDIELIIQNYEPFAFNSVIVTKCDETQMYGNVLSVLHEKNKSIAYITDGQRVPHNIRRASIVDFLIRLCDFTIDREHIDEKFEVK